MNFVKQVRLKHAKEMLTAPAPNKSVTSVAFACGFGNLGHFASDYRRAFGEMPSETLAGAKGGGLGDRLLAPRQRMSTTPGLACSSQAIAFSLSDRRKERASAPPILSTAERTAACRSHFRS